MTRALALEIRSDLFLVGRVSEVGLRRVAHIRVPASAVWETCRDGLLDAAGEDEIAAVGIACRAPINGSAGLVAPDGILEWRGGFAVVAAVQRMFPAAVVEIATDCQCLILAGRGCTPGRGLHAVLTGAAILALAAADRSVDRSLCPGIRTLRTRTEQSPPWLVPCPGDGPR
ncbi:hypothetical protein [Nocardia africana]